MRKSVLLAFALRRRLAKEQWLADKQARASELEITTRMVIADVNRTAEAAVLAADAEQELYHASDLDTTLWHLLNGRLADLGASAEFLRDLASFYHYAERVRSLSDDRRRGSKSRAIAFDIEASLEVLLEQSKRILENYGSQTTRRPA